jgi:DNA-binding beta-propeller fold protein YncE
MEDGSFQSSTFRSPQGMALDSDENTLFVADSENHAIRAVDRAARAVQTVAGTGEQLRRLARFGPARETSLSSPWDLALVGGALYIAMAGTHQVWTFRPDAESVAVWAGTGHEGIRDGTRQNAWLAQPMGIAPGAGAVYAACAETQAVRRIDLERDAVATVVGQGLFVWGEVDGPAATALFQHNQGVAVDANLAYVADTYNNRIRRIDLRAGQVVTLAGSGRVGLLDGPPANARFNQPSGLAVHSGTLYIADTNNHAIRTIDLDSGHVATLTLTNLRS